MPTRLCLAERCPNPATYRGRCAVHARQRNAETVSANKRIYNSHRWQILRRHILHHNPLCPCGDIAIDVHHKTDIQDGGDPWAPDNLEALCHSCHSRITRRVKEPRLG